MISPKTVAEMATAYSNILYKHKFVSKVTGNAVPIINLSDLDKEEVVVPETTK